MELAPVCNPLLGQICLYVAQDCTSKSFSLFILVYLNVHSSSRLFVNAD